MSWLCSAVAEQGKAGEGLINGELNGVCPQLANTEAAHFNILIVV